MSLIEFLYLGWGLNFLGFGYIAWSSRKTKIKYSFLSALVDVLLVTVPYALPVTTVITICLAYLWAWRIGRK